MDARIIYIYIYIYGTPTIPANTSKILKIWTFGGGDIYIYMYLCPIVPFLQSQKLQEFEQPTFAVALAYKEQHAALSLSLRRREERRPFLCKATTNKHLDSFRNPRPRLLRCATRYNMSCRRSTLCKSTKQPRLLST